MQKMITTLFGLSLLSLLPTAALAGGSVSAIGKSDFYYSGDEAISIARYEAKNRLSLLYEKQGLRFYEGKYLDDPIGHKYSLVKYSDLNCKERDGQKNCSVKATGHCISKDSEYFSIKCDKDNKSRVNGRAEIIQGGGLRIMTDNGLVVNFNHETVQKGSGYAKICPDSADKSGKYKDKVKRYIINSLKSHQQTCNKFKEKGVKMPEACQKAGFGVNG